MRALIRSFGCKGYGVWWLLSEMVAKEGKSEENWCLLGYKEWEKEIMEVAGVDKVWITKFLKKVASLHLVDYKRLEQGDLCIPQMSEYCDDYTERKKRLRTNSEHTTDNVSLEENRRDKKREEKKKNTKKKKKTPINKIISHFFKLKGWDDKSKEFYKRKKIIYARYTRPAKELYELCNKDMDLVFQKLDNIKGWADEKGLEWTIGTAIKRWNEDNESEGSKVGKYWEFIKNKNKKKYGI